MNKILINLNSSGIEIIKKFKEFIKQNHDQIIVRLTEPGIKYFEKEKWYSFINLIEEHRDKNITYYGCNFSNKSTE